MKPEISRTAMSAQERRLRAHIAQIVAGAGILHGSLVVRKRICGKPNCHCAKGEGHRALVLTVRREGKTEQIYIPRHLEATVQRWVAQDHELRDLIGDLGYLHREKVRELKSRSEKSSDAS